MKLHYSVIVLVGWYLMIAPIDANNPQAIDSNAQIEKWLIFSVFDSASECQIKVNAMRSEALEGQIQTNVTGQTGRLSLTPDQLKERLITSQCIATDDPRLTQKQDDYGQPRF